MSSQLIVANWKMNKTIEDVEVFIQDLKKKFVPIDGHKLIICPNFLSLGLFKQNFLNSEIYFGAQNCHYEFSGAYTGEISASMLKKIGCGYCIVGHSERRTLFKETNDDVAKKVQALQKEDLIPIACVGESLDEKNKGETLAILDQQLSTILLKHDKTKKIVIAYEPIWAIGTGQVASHDDINKAHQFIREKMEKMLGEAAARQTHILYGGSVTPENSKEIGRLNDVNGFLIGGASLKVESLLEIY